MAKLSTLEDFIEKAKEKHGDYYDYSLVQYINNNTKIKIICPIHGEFEQTPRGHTSGYKCKLCNFKSYLKNKNDIIMEFNQKYDYKYDYSLVEYVNSETKIKIICPTHGEFEQRPYLHLKGIGCSECSKEKHLKKYYDFFIEKSFELHKYKYDYSLVQYIGNHEYVKIICPIHGEFEQTPHNHKKGKGCSKCNDSKGEKTIREYLEKNKINYIPQYKFPDCKDKKVLAFDFYLPDYNTCVEYQGIQHYEPVKLFGGEEKFIIQQKRDKIKMEYCLNNNIPLTYIKYNESIVDKLKLLLNVSIIR